jgi:hypothetical protein
VVHAIPKDSRCLLGNRFAVEVFVINPININREMKLLEKGFNTKQSVHIQFGIVIAVRKKDIKLKRCGAISDGFSENIARRFGRKAFRVPLLSKPINFGKCD